MKKRNLKEAWRGWRGKFHRSVLLAAGIATGCLYGMLWESEVYAEERIQVIDLCVVEDEEGIRASCVYQNSDSGSSILQLYLEKLDSQGEFYPLNYVDLAAAGDEAQTASTLPLPSEPGKYRAVLLQYFGEGTPVVRFRDSGVYEIKGSGEPDEGDTDGAGLSDRTAEEMEISRREICEHSLLESIICQATPVQDAILAKSCEHCGQFFGYTEIPNSAYVSFLDRSADLIGAALPGEQVTITTDRWVSFDTRVLEAMESRRDISILLKYRYQGAEHQAWIPEGGDVTGLEDENGFCGFCCLSQRFAEKIDE